MTIRNPFRDLDPVEMLAQQLIEARRDRVTYAARLEEYASQVTMLDARIARIKQEIQAMNQEKETPQ